MLYQYKNSRSNTNILLVNINNLQGNLLFKLFWFSLIAERVAPVQIQVAHLDGDVIAQEVPAQIKDITEI